MSKIAYDSDKEALAEKVRELEAEGYEVTSEARWNNFGECWIVVLEKRTEP